MYGTVREKKKKTRRERRRSFNKLRNTRRGKEMEKSSGRSGIKITHGRS
jgi:hypothetical protein